MTEMPTDASLSTLTALGEELFAAEQKILNIEAKLKEAKADRDVLSGTTIPEFLAEAGIEELTMSGGRKIEVKEILSVTPKAADRPSVFAALEEQGAGALIKTTISCPFGKGQDEKVKEILDMLAEAGVDTKLDKKVEPPTLKKHIRLRLEAGESVDMKLFNVKQFKQAVFSKGKPTEAVFEGE